jgi:GNAT superfamily N-acetyltransferase
MSGLKFISINNDNNIIAKELLAEYGNYLLDELKLADGNSYFFKTLERFPDKNYSPPNGDFFIVYDEDKPIGCVGIKKFDNSSCELKRMFIKEEFRGKGFAKIVIQFILDQAKLLGYQNILLDTNVEMPAAISAYLKAGFVEIPPYFETEHPNPVFFAYNLNNV